MNKGERRAGAEAGPGPRALKDALAGVVGAAAAEMLETPSGREPGGPATPLEGLALYVSALMRWNSRMNLVGARDWREAARDLLADSILLAAFLRRLRAGGFLPGAPVVWDLGAGAGLPGIPLRLVWDEGEYHLVEARQKRSIFLADMCARLELPRTFVHGERAETFFAAHEGQGQVVVSRAFMPWDRLLPFVAPHMARPALVVCLANEPAPANPPAPWRTVAEEDYAAPLAASGRRWFWALRAEAGEGRPA